MTGTFTDNSDFIGDYAASDVERRRLRRAQERDQRVRRRSAPDADVGAVRSRDRRRCSTSSSRRSRSQDQQELKDSIAEQLNQLLGIVYALLLLSVIVSLFGIVNTLALSIHERTRELGLLRAVGTSRRQVRRMVRYEAVITALIGAVLGLVLGVLFAVIVSRPLADEGFTLSIPFGHADRAARAGGARRACSRRSARRAGPRASTCSRRSPTSDAARARAQRNRAVVAGRPSVV